MPSRVLRDGTSAMDQMFHLFKLWIIQAMPEITANRIIPPIALFIAAPKNIPAMLATTIIMMEAAVLIMQKPSSFEFRIRYEKV